jgi:hypothetical protein
VRPFDVNKVVEFKAKKDQIEQDFDTFMNSTVSEHKCLEYLLNEKNEQLECPLACHEIARELRLFSNTSRPHAKFVSEILKDADIGCSYDDIENDYGNVVGYVKLYNPIALDYIIDKLKQLDVRQGFNHVKLNNKYYSVYLGREKAVLIKQEKVSADKLNKVTRTTKEIGLQVRIELPYTPW